MLPPPPPSASKAPVPPGGVSGTQNTGPEIVVMPEKYYGMALKMDGKTQAEMMAPPPAPKPVAPAPRPPMPGPIPSRPIWPFIVLAIVILLLVIGGFVWFNRNTFFKTPAPVVIPPPVVQTPPSAPSSLSATVASGTTAVQLAWIDTSGDESGYRVERREQGGTFLPITNLPANSNSFLDVSVQAGHSYDYRVFALGVTGDSASSNEANAVIQSAAPAAPVIPTLPPGGLDSDSDGITDTEEVIFGTDSHVPDTDRDGFLDGNEVFHLYNPAAKAPVRLVDSGLVTPLVAPSGWSIFAPKTWSARLDTTDGSRATILSGQGETFRIELVDNPQKMEAREWYLAQNPGVASTAVRSITTKGGLEGILGADRLDAFFAWDGKVFKIVYDNDSKSFINFRTTFEMMLNSLRLSGAPVLSPEVVNASLQGPGDFISTTSTSATSTTP